VEESLEIAREVMGRPVAVTAANNSARDEVFAYDLDGNLVRTGEFQELAFDAADQVLTRTGASYDYDTQGNLTRTIYADGSRLETPHDSMNRIMGLRRYDDAGVLVRELEYVYDALSRRVATAEDGVASHRIFAFDNLIGRAETDLDGSQAIAAYLVGPSLDDVFAATVDGVTRYLHRDEIGSVRLVTTSDAAVIGSSSYSLFGRTIFQSGANDTELGYTARPSDGQTGLIDLRARMYDPALGRFLARDPISTLALGDTLYAYSGNRPTVFSDPSGLSAQSPLRDVFSSVISGISDAATGLFDAALDVVSGVVSGVFDVTTSLATSYWTGQRHLASGMAHVADAIDWVIDETHSMSKALFGNSPVSNALIDTRAEVVRAILPHEALRGPSIMFQGFDLIAEGDPSLGLLRLFEGAGKVAEGVSFSLNPTLGFQDIAISLAKKVAVDNATTIVDAAMLADPRAAAAGFVGLGAGDRPVSLSWYSPVPVGAAGIGSSLVPGPVRHDVENVHPNIRINAPEILGSGSYLVLDGPSAGHPSEQLETVSQDALRPIVAVGMSWWRSCRNRTEVAHVLSDIELYITDLPNLVLGLAVEDLNGSGTRAVLIDRDAAGLGWFIDATPADNSEFSAEFSGYGLSATIGSFAYGKVDLVTVVAHELGHLLGFEDLEPDTHQDALMAGKLPPGVRRLPFSSLRHVQDTRTGIRSSDHCTTHFKSASPTPPGHELRVDLTGAGRAAASVLLGHREHRFVRSDHEEPVAAAIAWLGVIMR
jgi:RHS repeat-associated protein